MRMRHGVILLTVIALIGLPVLTAGQSLSYPMDAQTGRAVGAKEMTAAELKQKIDTGEPVLVIELRDVSFYEKERIRW
jgi:hypothetical protein